MKAKGHEGKTERSPLLDALLLNISGGPNVDVIQPNGPLLANPDQAVSSPTLGLVEGAEPTLSSGIHGMLSQGHKWAAS